MSSANLRPKGVLDTISIDEFRPYTYALTISPTKDPTTKTVIDCNVKLSGFLSSTFDGKRYALGHELKNKTDVVHLHCWVITKKPVDFSALKAIKRLNPGWQFYFKPILTRADLERWTTYCLKHRGERNTQRLVEHDLNTTYSFY